ncbi:hypothetical protein RvY_19198 [Ramazzottius varieornatus]|uniref:Uncharacterized protein n=1 Tax=Ramazzottius varieornatus TaxID=947166 RepID=A0A1D1W8L3_RAMVA|nr:hypothetical protein RvY_19198 [Ramazzottius varieornatus]
MEAEVPRLGNAMLLHEPSNERNFERAHSGSSTLNGSSRGTRGALEGKISSMRPTL